MTVDQFLNAYEGVGGRYELVDGHVRSVTGLSAAHAIVSGNILILLMQLFRGRLIEHLTPVSACG
ncbi:Uma2 family endonuclease [Polymorphobacter megasporae]|uniref:Uma2 family endonuclease n=1 Tax=Glacieibacterium megasporae TaxID=2835787 RepID=UPI001C1DF85B|nr:Uma2 family endonuclease [Polymorphobacter megasporae]UAJ10373.1 Uma2 family endonuclease [Polymorphobacter megasporae]